MALEEMEINVNELGPCEREITVVVPPDVYRKAYEREIREAEKSLLFKGFRQGHVPRNIILQYAGKQIEAHIIESVIAEAISKALDSKGLKPVSEIKLDKPEIGEDKRIKLKFSFEIYPAIEPKNYMNLSIEMEPMKQWDEGMIDAEVALLRKRWAKLIPAGDDEVVGEDCLIVMDFKVTRKDNNEVFAESKDVYYIVGSGILRFEGLDEAVIGMKKGEEKSFASRFQEGIEGVEKGTEAEISVKIEEIKKRFVPPLDDETVRQNSQFQTVEDLRNAIGLRISEKFRKHYELALKEKIIDALLAENPFEVPKGVVNYIREKNREAARKAILAYMPKEKRGEVNLNFDDEIDTKEAERSLRIWLLVNAIAEKEGFSVSDEELEEELAEMAKARGVPCSEILGEIKPEDVKNAMLIDKTMEILKKYAVIKEPSKVSK